MRIQTGRPTFTQDVAVFTPVNNGHRREILKTTFNHLDVEEVDRFDLQTTQGTTDFLKEVVSRFDGLTADETGEAVPYSEELRSKLCNLQHVRQALCKSFFDNVSKVKAGN